MNSLLRNKVALICTTCALALPLQAETCNDLETRLSTRDVVSAYLKQETTKDVLCAIALLPDGQESSYCYAIFPYRDPQAVDAFERLGTTLTDCFVLKAAVGTGDIVNHPDSFDQNAFCAADYELSLSLKDKGNLNQTLIFLRLDGKSASSNACQ